MTDSDRESNELSADEFEFLRRALGEWGGPARPTDAFAIAMGFTSAARLSAECRALRDRIDGGESLLRDDARRVLLAIEIVFASDVVGSGHDWRYTTGFSDEESIQHLRGIQKKAGRAHHQSGSWRPRPQ